MNKTLPSRYLDKEQTNPTFLSTPAALDPIEDC